MPEREIVRLEAQELAFNTGPLSEQVINNGLPVEQAGINESERQVFIDQCFERLQDCWNRQQTFMTRLETIYQGKARESLGQSGTLGAMMFLGIDLDRAKEVAAIGLIPEVWTSAYESMTSGNVRSLQAHDLELIN